MQGQRLALTKSRGGCRRKRTGIVCAHGDTQAPRQTGSHVQALCNTRFSRRLHMDGNAASVSPDDLYTHLGTAAAPLLIDVRRREAFDADKFVIIGAARRLPEDVSKWRNALPAGKAIAAYCPPGPELTQTPAPPFPAARISPSYPDG